MDVTPDQIEALDALTDLDGQIRKLNKTLGALPEQQAVEEAEAKVATHESLAKQLVAATEEVDAEVKKLEREIKQFSDRLEAERQKLYGGEVTSQKAMQANEREIESLERRVSEREDAELAALEKNEELAKDIVFNNEALEDAQQAVVDANAARDDAAQVLLAQIAEAEVSRDKQRGVLAGPVLDAYDARAAKPGRAFGHLDGNTCTACGMELPVGEANGLRGEGGLVNCPSCTALLSIK